MKEVHQTITTLIIHGASEKVDSHIANLSNITTEYAAWLSDDIAIQLKPFEHALNEISALSHLSNSLGEEEADGRKATIKKTHEIFREILQLEKDSGIAEKSEIDAETVLRKVRSILGVEELTKLRKALVNNALSFIDRKS